MKITIKDCDLTVCRKLDTWLVNKDIVDHAMFDQTFTNEYTYYHDENNKYSEIVLQKVIYIDNVLIAYVVLMYYMENDKYEVCFNPFVINPDYQNLGHGKNILKHIIDNIESIVKGDVNYFVATINIKNTISIRLFKSLGFVKTGQSTDKTYNYYKLNNDI